MNISASQQKLIGKFGFWKEFYYISLNNKTMQKATKTNPLNRALRNMNVFETQSFGKTDRDAVISEIENLNNTRNEFEFTHEYNTRKGILNVVRVVPTHRMDRATYGESISKKRLTETLKANNWSKQKAALSIGVSPRTIGRLVERKGVTLGTPVRENVTA